MSRIGKQPINLPEGVTVTVAEGNEVTVKGKLGETVKKFDEAVSVSVSDNEIVVKRVDDSRRSRSMHGLVRSLVANMVTGVSKGFSKKLVIKGVGYKANKQGSKLNLRLGFSHPVVMEDPEGLTTECPTDTEIIVKGIDNQQVGNYAAKIRELRKPEPYKGKGIRYEDEYVRRKEGKLAAQ